LLTERPKARMPRTRLKVTKKILSPQPDLQKKTVDVFFEKKKKMGMS